MISTLVVPTAGQALVDGIESVADPLGVRARVGMLSDARGLYGRLTARENIAYYGELRGMDSQRIDAAIARLSEMLDLGPLLPRRTDGFSQGERMKVAIARTLVHDPPNVMLDEPTNGLDVMTTRNLREVLRPRHAKDRHEVPLSSDRVGLGHAVDLRERPAELGERVAFGADQYHGVGHAADVYTSSSHEWSAAPRVHC